MGYRVSEQEEIMEMVKAGECGDVLYKLDKGQVKRFPGIQKYQRILQRCCSNTEN